MKRASLEEYHPYYGTDEEAPLVETPDGVEDDSAKPSDTEIDAMEQFEK